MSARQWCDEHGRYDECVQPALTADQKEARRLDAVEDGECFCHVAPPCSWCELLNEAEADAWASGGRSAVLQLVVEERGA